VLRSRRGAHLSDVSTSNVSFHMPRRCSAPMSASSVSSMESAIASSTRRRAGTHVESCELLGTVGSGETGLRGVGLCSAPQSNQRHEEK
jgi:hypothetical protein